MKAIIVAAGLALLAGCASESMREASSTSGATAREEAIPLYEQNPANCAELSMWACRRYR